MTQSFTLVFQTGYLQVLSEQVLMDCSWGFGNNACDGGEEWRAYEWIMKHGGIAPAETYGPYLGMVSSCLLPTDIVLFTHTHTHTIEYNASEIMSWFKQRAVIFFIFLLRYLQLPCFV